MRLLFFLAKLAFSIGITIYVIGQVNTNEVFDAISSAPIGAILAAVGLIIISFIVGAARWCWIVSHSASALPFWAALRLLFEALFFNQLLPSMIGGDAVRVVRSSSTSEMTLGDAFRSVVLDRMTGLLALAALTAIAFCIALAAGVSLKPQVSYAAAIMLAMACAGLVLVASFGLIVQDSWRTSVPIRLVRFYDQIVLIARDFVHLNSSPLNSLVLNGLGILVHVLIVASVFFIGLGLGMNSNILGYFIAVPVSILISSLPISIAGWGVREAIMVAAFGSVGVQPSIALASSIIFGALLAALGVLGGAFFVAVKDRTPNIG